MTTTVTAVAAERLDDRARTDIARIYSESFPPDEREDLDRLLTADRGLLTATDQGTVLAFALWISVNRRTWLLEYMAVDPAHRSSGIGRRLLDSWEAMAVADGRVETLLLEIEDPDLTDAVADALRRERFYEKWGASRIPCLRTYNIPSFVDGLPIPMCLLCRSLGVDPPTGDDLRDTLTDLYAVVYPEADGLLNHVLGEIIC